MIRRSRRLRSDSAARRLLGMARGGGGAGGACAAAGLRTVPSFSLARCLMTTRCPVANGWRGADLAGARSSRGLLDRGLARDSSPRPAAASASPLLPGAAGPMQGGGEGRGAIGGRAVVAGAAPQRLSTAGCPPSENSRNPSLPPARPRISDVARSPYFKFTLHAQAAGPRTARIIS